MPRHSMLWTALALCALLLGGVTNGRRLFGDSRRDYYERAERQARAEAASPPLERRMPTKEQYRFYNNASKAYNVESLPLIPYDIGEFYSGVMPIDYAKPHRGMFFVFEPTVGPPVDEITIWFNGGPGCSSLEGFLQENGLFVWQWGQYTPQINPYSWVNLTNMLWVEYPVGVGFSTGEVTAKSEEETAADFIGFFKNFQKTFGIKNFKIYVTGESYAGRYVPYVSAAMLNQKDKTHFDLSGAITYDPCIGQYEYVGNQAPIVPFVQRHKRFFNFNDTFMEHLELMHQYCGYANFTSYYTAFPPRAMMPPITTNTTAKCDLWYLVYDAAYAPNPCFNVYEINLMCPILFDPLAYPTDVIFNYPGNTIYFNRPDVKKAMHAPQHIQWRECSGPVFVGSGGQYGYGDHSADPIQAVLPQVIEATNRVLVANGDYDMEILTHGTLLSIQNMTWHGKMGFQSKPSKPIEITLPDLQYQKALKHSGLGGLDGPRQGVMGVQHYERGLMWAETFQSGHMEPQFQPRSSYRHLQWVLGRIDEL